MTSFHTRIAALLVGGVVFTAGPLFAQHGGRRNGGEHERHNGAQRAEPRREAESHGRFESHGGVAPQERFESNRGHDNRGYDNRRYENRSHGYQSYGYRSHGYYSYGRSYVLPYGYRPYGYRPGWSLNLYFGRPYYGYAYRGYGYPTAGYGYYALAPGRAYGAVRIVDAPRDARVFVDGYYAGLVDDYDGVFQHLSLEAGSHHIEIGNEGYPSVGFDVLVEPGQTVTYRANMR